LSFGYKLSDLRDDSITNPLESLVELVNLSALGKGHHGDLVFGQTSNEILVGFEYFKGVPQDVVLVAAVTLRVVFSN
jgi:hypothetical protein